MKNRTCCCRGLGCPRRKNGTARRTGRRRTTRLCAPGTRTSCRPWAGPKTRPRNTRRPRRWPRTTTRSPSRRPRPCARPAGRPSRRRTTGERRASTRRRVKHDTSLYAHRGRHRLRLCKRTLVRAPLLASASIRPRPRMLPCHYYVSTSIDFLACVLQKQNRLLAESRLDI